MAKQTVPTIKELYPKLTEDELREAEENFDGYLEVVWRITQRVHNDPVAYARFKALTAARDSQYDGDERST